MTDVGARAREGVRADPGSRYRELLPSPALRTRLVCTWIQTVGDGAREHLHRVLPDGCVDLVWIGASAPLVAGPATRWVDVPLPPGATVIGVRLRPGSVPEALGVPASELLDREVALRDLWGRSADEVSAAAPPTAAPEARLAAVEEGLVARWAGTAPEPWVVTSAIAWLARHPGGRMQALAAQLGLSTRQLQRRFVAAVGYAPKTFQRIVRFQRLLELGSGARPAGSLGALALAAGYADQPHMGREVAELAGSAPGALLGRRGSTLRMSDPFKAGADARRTLST